MKGIRKPRVIIIGAGFAGLWTARNLAKANVDVLVVDRNNYHTFFPLLYQVAAAEVEPEQIAYPVRGIFQRVNNVDFTMDELTSVDFAHRQIQLTDRTLDYDYLVLAMGSESHFFGIPGVAQHAFELKTLEQGIDLRNHILSRFEYATHAKNPQRKRQALTFAVVGGGPTGVEFAGALAELVAGTLARDYPTLNLSDVNVLILEAGNGLLAGFHQELRDYTIKKLQQLGVETRLGAQVSHVSKDTITLADGQTLAADTVIWTAGVQGAPLARELNLPTAPNGQVLCKPTLQLEQYPQVFVAGDLCHFQENERPLPQTAPVAMQQGKHVARSILHHKDGKKLAPFKYKDKGAMATIGRKAAVVRLGKRIFSGFSAWILWLFVHLLYLVGFRNRLFVLTNWAWDYFFFDRGVRLILPKEAPRRTNKNGGEQHAKE